MSATLAPTEQPIAQACVTPADGACREILDADAAA